MKDPNPEIPVTAQMPERAAGVPGTWIFVAEKDEKRIIDFAGTKLSPIDLRLTSNPSHEKVNALYQPLGFEKRDTNVYKMSLWVLFDNSFILNFYLYFCRRKV